MNELNIILENYLSQKPSFKYRASVSPELDIDGAVIQKFINFTLDHLGIFDETSDLKVYLDSSRDNFTTYAYYAPNSKEVHVYSKNRALMDILRSLAHEIVHYKQDIKGELKQEYIRQDNDGEPIENEANSVAGVIMRKFGRENKNLY